MARKKRKQAPQAQDLYTYRGQLGLPTPERAAHMPDGFETRQLAAGHDKEGGVVQARIQTILTHPATLAALYSETIQAYQDKKLPIPERIVIAQKPADRATARNRRILWEYLTTHIEVEGGNVKIVNYEGTQGGGSIHRLPLPERQYDRKLWDRRKFYAWVRRQPGMKCLTGKLDWLAEHDDSSANPDADTILTRYDVGRSLLDKEIICPSCGRNHGHRAPRSGVCLCGHKIAARDRDAEQAFIGAISQAADALAEAACHFVSVENKRRLVAV